MSIAAAQMTLGLYAPNLTFAIPGATSGLAAGWKATTSGAVVASGMYTGGPAHGHPRHQVLALTGAGQSVVLKSAPCKTGQLGNAASQLWLGAWVLCKFSAAGASTLKVELAGYDANETTEEVDTIATLSPIYDTWTLVTGSGRKDLSAAHHRRYKLTLSGGTTASVSLAFVGIGTTFDAVYTSVAKVAVGTSPIQPTAQAAPAISPQGFSRWIDSDRVVNPRRGTLRWDGLGETEAGYLEWFWSMQTGRYGGESSQGGGHWPVLLIPGIPSWPHAMMCRFEGDRFPLEHVGDWYPDSPLYGGALQVVEEL